MITIDTRFRLSAQSIIQRAGEILLSYFMTNLERTEKEGNGFVTQADIASEQFLIKELGALFPDARFYAEESGESGNQDSDYCWVIDPLDGTTNFAAGLPYFCVSVALTYAGKPIFGMIYQPLLKELFWAQKGKGVFLNDKQLRFDKVPPLNKSMIVVGLPYSRTKYYQEILEDIRIVAPKTYAFRHLGAAALDCAYVAAGRLNGVFFADLAWWDVAAGMLLVQEAGGKVTDFDGKSITKEYKTFIAASRPIHEDLFVLLKNNK